MPKNEFTGEVAQRMGIGRARAVNALKTHLESGEDCDFCKYRKAVREIEK